ncbi:uncharacterized protein [Bemisia tabaci]|uniref:uncharacterized protein n=1 Tax=Bemisia tabaci TaxID=7038 RepID=UPI003B2869D8
MNFQNDGRWSLGIGMGLFLLAITISSLLVISVCQQNAYVWLGIVMVSIIFLTTFTCTTQVPILWAQETDSRENSVVEGDPAHNLSPYWIRVTDLPPSYSVATSHHVMAFRGENVEPPPYSTVILQTPNITYGHSNPVFNYNEPDVASLQQVTAHRPPAEKSCANQPYLCERCHHETNSVPQGKTEKTSDSGRSLTSESQPSDRLAENQNNNHSQANEVLPPDRPTDPAVLLSKETHPQSQSIQE